MCKLITENQNNEENSWENEVELHMVDVCPLFMLKYSNFEEYSICIFLWPPMVLPRETLVLHCTPMLLIGRSNKSHEVVLSNCKGGSFTPQCGY